MLVEPPREELVTKIALDQFSIVFILVTSCILIYVKLKIYILLYADGHIYMIFMYTDGS